MRIRPARVRMHACMRVRANARARPRVFQAPRAPPLCPSHQQSRRACGVRPVRAVTKGGRLLAGEEEDVRRLRQR
eukprot:4437511-Pleurochrysis_carterae.AAC.1